MQDNFVAVASIDAVGPGLTKRVVVNGQTVSCTLHGSRFSVVTA